MMIGDILGLAFVVGIVYVLVRPRSKAGELVEAVTGLVAALARRVVGSA